jgi:hypothetical protein
MAVWSILLPFSIICGHLAYFFRFGKLYKEKSGNPAWIHAIARKDIPFVSIQDAGLFKVAVLSSCTGVNVMRRKKGHKAEMKSKSLKICSYV